ncbi:hypothetical protein PS918_03363 [Pseudomonas fluorescens]|uniref:Uncharacterized protein n=1 Tax=Pseudomonas fluorescens TaxID=294 RepID=A0A5E7T225_PSEFL|nr:hypothetical protein [Pseudomonas fluorescens]VVP92354.1 hypothetical protein PS918_03363 [Pseudomonas fluorescens]
MLAMVVNDDAGCLNERGVWAFIASMLAPTVDRGPSQSQVGFQAASLWLLILIWAPR